jgi:endonuclease-3
VHKERGGSQVTAPAPVLPVVRTLIGAFGDTALYNVRNPLWELLFIVCSTMTQESNYRASYGSLRQAFPTLASLESADVTDLQVAIARSGLSRRKAGGMVRIIERLITEFGRPTLAPLRGWTDTECERFLTSLPLVGLKSARCVMLFSLDRQAFPVDTHCWRVSGRLGWSAAPIRAAPTARDMDALQARIPPHLRGPLHVSMVGFGRQICRALRPRCAECVLAELCPSAMPV